MSVSVTPKELPDLDNFSTSKVRLLGPTIKGNFQFLVWYGLNICVPPQIRMLKPNPQGGWY